MSPPQTTKPSTPPLPGGPTRLPLILPESLPYATRLPDSVTEPIKIDAASATANDTPQDYQLARALDLLRGLALFNERAVN